MAIEAAQLYEQAIRQDRLQHEIELAHSIQESFMPERCPQLPGWQLVAEWQAARGIGGDYYDFIELDAGQLGLLIADVSDKGVAAALYMALTRTLMRVAAFAAHGPAAALGQLNRYLLDEAKSGMFVSVFYAVLDLQSGHLTYARAGHNPPILVRAADGTPIELVPPGTVLGIVDAPNLVEESLTLSPGDVLVMYTDGVTEAIDEHDQQFGETRLQEIVTQGVGSLRPRPWPIASPLRCAITAGLGLLLMT